MILWLTFAALAAAVVVLLLYPVFRGGKDAAGRIAYDMTVYRDQLAEIGKDAERGMMTPEQAEAARAEIYRRMLAAEDAENTRTAASSRRGMGRVARIVLAAFLAVGVPAGAFSVYAALGSPSLPARPYAARADDPDIIANTKAEKLAAQLEANPSAAGYKKLGDIYFLANRYDEAAAAYRKETGLAGNDAAAWSALGEAMAMANDGIILPGARHAFAEAYRLNRTDARTRFYLGLAEAQHGDLRRAVAIWRDLQKDTPKDAPWAAMLNGHIAAFSKQGGFAPDTIAPQPPDAGK
ncbi:MAG: c-type cytochrome biogenesis protein CcmI [Alphaproteobacteria bacterium]|nr:c-type cytochrome biogenesis protein CcmI [Alphaproteobacteria bacterium]